MRVKNFEQGDLILYVGNKKHLNQKLRNSSYARILSIPGDDHYRLELLSLGESIDTTETIEYVWSRLIRPIIINNETLIALKFTEANVGFNYSDDEVSIKIKSISPLYEVEIKRENKQENFQIRGYLTDLIFECNARKANFLELDIIKSLGRRYIQRMAN